MISAASQARHLGTHQATSLDGSEGGCAAVAPRTSTPSPLSSPSSSPFSSSSTVGVGAGAVVRAPSSAAVDDGVSVCSRNAMM